MAELCERLRLLRQEQNMTQKQMAELLSRPFVPTNIASRDTTFRSIQT